MKLKHKLTPIFFVALILGSTLVGLLAPRFEQTAQAFTDPNENKFIISAMYNVCTRHKPFTIDQITSAARNLQDSTTLKDAGVSSNDAQLVGPKAASSIDQETVYNYFYWKDYQDVSNVTQGNPCNVAATVVTYGDSLNRSPAADTKILQQSLASQAKSYNATTFSNALTSCPKTALTAANSASGGFTEANYETQLRKCLNSKLSNLPKSALDAAMKAIADPNSLVSSSTQCDASQVDAGGQCAATSCQGTIGANNQCLDPSTDNGSGTSTDLSCDSQVPVLGWLLCKLIDGIQNAVGGIYDHIINPLLTLEPITHKTSSGAVNPIYTAWSNFRIYGDVFLFIAVLVIVFGESIGGGILDAYSVKKIMPRLLIAALLINISFYLVAIAVDIANIVGTGLSDLITAPFRMGGNFDLQVGTTGSVGLTTLLVGAIVWAKITLAGQFLAWLWFSVLLPLLMIFLAIMVTVLLRQALVIFLVIISPVAFALYCLPNTEKYFKKWWDMLFETLLVFPIIASLFAMGKVSAYLLSNSTNQSFLANGISNIMAVIALVIPLLLIPFSFKIAGGLIGRAHELATGARTKMNLGGATRERIKAQGARNRLQARGSAYAALQKQGSKGDPSTLRGKLRRNTIGRLATGTSGLLGYNVEAEMSAARAEVSKTLNDQIATGKDDEIRGLTVNKNTSRSRMNNGVKEYETLGGAWVKEADVDRGHARWGKDTFAQQTALSYEMRKAMDEGQLQTLAKNYRSVAQGIDASGRKVGGGWGMTDEQAGGAWIGAAFERQNEHLEYKSTDWRTGQLSQDSKTAAKDANGNAIAGTGLSGVGLVDEVYEKKGSYPVSQMGSNTIQQLQESWKSAERVLSGVDDKGNAVTYTDDQRMAALDHQGKLQAIAETFMHEAGGAEGIVIGQTESGENVVGNGAGKRQSGAQGAAHVAERVREFAVLTGSYEQAPSGQYIKRDHAPTPNGREQK